MLTYRIHDTTGDDLGLIEHPAPTSSGTLVMLADAREAARSLGLRLGSSRWPSGRPRPAGKGFEASTTFARETLPYILDSLEGDPVPEVKVILDMHPRNTSVTFACGESFEIPEGGVP